MGRCVLEVCSKQTMAVLKRKSVYESDSFMLSIGHRPSRSHLKKELHRLIVAQSDVSEAFQAWETYVETLPLENYALRRALLSAIVISYCRPFTSNEGFGVLPAKWSHYSDARHRKWHDQLLKARNEVIAHSDQAIRQVTIVPAGIELRPKLSGQLTPVSSEIGFEVQTYTFGIQHISKLGSMIGDVGKRMLSEIERLLQDLYGGMDLPRRKFPLRVDEGL